MSEQRNPRFWASQWYSTSKAKEPWPGGWYWHDEVYTWSGPFKEEEEAAAALEKHLADEEKANAASEHPRRDSSFSLYYHPLSTPSQKALIALREKGFEFEPRIVDLEDDEERERYLKIYPMGQLPLLALNHGPIIPESSIIAEYLDGLGGARLIPKDPDAARKTRYKDRMFDYLAAAAGVLFRQALAGERDNERTKEARDHVKIVFDFIENELGEQPWINGEEFSLADCAAAAALFHEPRAVSFDDYPKMAAYAARLAKRASVHRVRAEAAPYLAAVKKRHAA
jgi:glutathione S-transferase